MKAITKHALGIILLSWLSTMTFAQTQETNQPDPVTQFNEGPKTLTDPTISKQLQNDFTTRYPSISTQSVTWFDAGYGYYGTYDVDQTNYIARYDKKGNYVETLKKKDWSDQANPSLQKALNQSSYKDQDVTGYWESSNPNQKGYYMQLSDEQGKTSRVWVNGKNEFSITPSILSGNTAVVKSGKK